MTFTAREMAETVRRARQARGLSLQQLADLAGIGKTAMFDLEHGNTGVRLRTLLAVLEVLGLDMHLGQSGTRPNSPPPAASFSFNEKEQNLPDRLL